MKENKKIIEQFAENDLPVSLGKSNGVKSKVGSTWRTVHPLGMRVMVQIRRDSNVTDTGLYLPEGAKESKQESLLGEVLEVASAVDSDTSEETNISGIPEGALVLIAKDSGVRVPWDEDLRLVDTQDVLAIVCEQDIN